MKRKKIILPQIIDVKEFVRQAGKCNFDVDVSYNRVVVDAKSILAVMSLDFTKELTVEYSGENSGFETFLEQFVVA